MRRWQRWARDLRERIAPRAVVLEREETPSGWVVTRQHADYRSPSGYTYATIATWPDGSVASRRWTKYEVDARSAQQGEVVRHTRRMVDPEHVA